MPDIHDDQAAPTPGPMKVCKAVPTQEDDATPTCFAALQQAIRHSDAHANPAWQQPDAMIWHALDSYLLTLCDSACSTCGTVSAFSRSRVIRRDVGQAAVHMQRGAGHE